MNPPNITTTDQTDNHGHPPPSYSPVAGRSAAGLAGFASSGFPAGYFLIKSSATGRLFDVSGSGTDDGTEVILWKEKERSLVESMRDPEAENQIFFLDPAGTLCSKVNGLPIDVEENRLVVRHHHPVTYPFPNPFSHLLPRFSYEQRTGVIRVTFECDPNYPMPPPLSNNIWRERDFIVASVPRRRPKSILDTTADFLNSAASMMAFNPFGKPPAAEATAHVAEGDFDLREEEVLEEERAPEDEDDDSPSPGRDIRVLSLPLGWMEPKYRDSEAALQRRRWQIIPLLQTRVVTKPMSPRASTSSS